MKSVILIFAISIYFYFVFSPFPSFNFSSIFFFCKFHFLLTKETKKSSEFIKWG